MLPPPLPWRCSLTSQREAMIAMPKSRAAIILNRRAGVHSRRFYPVAIILHLLFLILHSSLRFSTRGGASRAVSRGQGYL